MSPNNVCAESELSPGHSLVLHSVKVCGEAERRCWAVTIIPLNPWKVVCLTQWHWKEMSSLHCNNFLWGFWVEKECLLNAVHFPLLFLITFKSSPADTRRKNHNKNALDLCLPPLWRPPHSAPLCSRLRTDRRLKGTDITLSHSSRRSDADTDVLLHWQRALSLSQLQTLDWVSCQSTKGEEARNNWLY